MADAPDFVLDNYSTDDERDDSPIASAPTSYPVASGVEDRSDASTPEQLSQGRSDSLSSSSIISISSSPGVHGAPESPGYAAESEGSIDISAVEQLAQRRLARLSSLYSRLRSPGFRTPESAGSTVDLTEIDERSDSEIDLIFGDRREVEHETPEDRSSQESSDNEVGYATSEDDHQLSGEFDGVSVWDENSPDSDSDSDSDSNSNSNSDSDSDFDRDQATGPNELDVGEGGNRFSSLDEDTDSDSIDGSPNENIADELDVGQGGNGFSSLDEDTDSDTIDGSPNENIADELDVGQGGNGFSSLDEDTDSNSIDGSPNDNIADELELYGRPSFADEDFSEGSQDDIVADALELYDGRPSFPDEGFSDDFDPFEDYDSDYEYSPDQEAALGGYGDEYDDYGDEYDDYGDEDEYIPGSEEVGVQSSGTDYLDILDRDIVDGMDEERDELMEVEMGTHPAAVIDLTGDSEDEIGLTGPSQSQNLRRQRSNHRDNAPSLNRSDASYVGRPGAPVIDLVSESDDDLFAPAYMSQNGHNRGTGRLASLFGGRGGDDVGSAQQRGMPPLEMPIGLAGADRPYPMTRLFERGLTRLTGAVGAFLGARGQPAEDELMIVGAPARALLNNLPLPLNLDYRMQVLEGIVPAGPAGNYRPPHVPPPKARPGFTRDTGGVDGETGEEQVIICPSCDEELAFDPDQDAEAGPPAKKMRTKRDRAENHFWAVRACGHVYCKQCYDNRKSKGRHAPKVGFQVKLDQPRKVFCAVDGCESDVAPVSAWVGIYT